MKKLHKRLQSLKQLPQEDPYRALKDFHTVNAVGFFGESLIRKVFDTKGRVKLGDFKKVEGGYINEDDHGLQFENGQIAVRKYFRNLSKPVGLALQYGGSSKVLEDKLGMNKATALRLWITFFKTLGVLKAHLDERLKRAEKTGYVENLFKARFYLPQLKDRKFYYQGKNKVYNTPIQSTASFLIKLAIIRSAKWMDKYRLNRYTANSIARQVKGEVYSRIVTIEKPEDGRRLLKALDRLKTGHTKILTLDEKGKVVEEYGRSVKLDKGTFDKFKMSIFF